MSILTMHQAVPRRRIAGGMLLLVVVLWAWFSVKTPSLPGHPETDVPLRKRASPTVVATRTASRQLADLKPVASRALTFRCDAQRFELDVDGSKGSQCVGPALALQNGSMRSYRAEPHDSGTKWILVDTAGGQLVGASVGQGSVTEFSCEGAACAGVGLGAPDLRGFRTIALNGVRLTAVAPSITKGAVVATLNGSLLTTVDDTNVSAVCAEQSLLVSAQGAPTQRFCPDDGTSVDNSDPLGPIYAFSSVDGPGVVVSLDREGRLRRVDQGAMFCVAPNCAGVSVLPPEAGGARPILFNGSMLQNSAHPEQWVGLSGRLMLP